MSNHFSDTFILPPDLPVLCGLLDARRWSPPLRRRRASWLVITIIRNEAGAARWWLVGSADELIRRQLLHTSYTDDVYFSPCYIQCLHSFTLCLLWSSSSRMRTRNSDQCILQCIQGCREGHDLDSSAQAFRSQAGFLALKPGSCPLVRFRLSKAPCISAPGFQGLFQVLMAGSSAAKMATSRSSQLDLSSF